MDHNVAFAQLDDAMAIAAPVGESENTTKVSEVIQPSVPQADQPAQITTTSAVPDGDAGAGINEDDLDKEFFHSKPGTAQAKKTKLNKGEKRALKFLMKKQLPGQ